VAKKSERGKKTPNFDFEYVTSAVSVLQNDGIVVHVLNDSGAVAKTQVLIYQNTGAGAVTVVDSGVIDVVATWVWGLGFTISTSGEYWLRVRATSEVLIPKASFERFQSSVWIPIVSYRPGDFAVFKLKPRRTRIW
jgi:hypothetical protein